ncbi:hypothetical protein V6N13_069818 [Hibiscus sabdariffa]|uniref:CASP-like protein n=1 Tax=Hibiscus sabdariffa TaxID=183260 RepID=A0ABR2BJ94_9ROSI
METPQASIGGNPPSKIGKLILAAQFFFRITVTGTTLAASHLIFKAKQNVDVMGMPFEAEYNYSPAFKFFASANAIACGFIFISLIFILFFRRRLTASVYFMFFIHDLVCDVADDFSDAIGCGGRDGNQIHKQQD